MQVQCMLGLNSNTTANPDIWFLQRCFAALLALAAAHNSALAATSVNCANSNDTELKAQRADAKQEVLKRLAVSAAASRELVLSSVSGGADIAVVFAAPCSATDA
jgi:hypothetical protein